MKRCTFVFRTGQLGDTFVSMPAIYEIRRHHPNDDLVLLTERQSRKYAVSTWDVLKPTNWFQGVIHYSASGKPKALTTAIDIFFQTRKYRPYRIYYLSENRRSWFSLLRDFIFFRWILGISNCYGFSHVQYLKKYGSLPVAMPE